MKSKLGIWVNDTASILGKVNAIKAMGFDYIVARVVHRDRNTGNLVPHQPVNLGTLRTEAAAAHLPVYCWAYVYPTNVNQQITAISAALPTPCDHLILDVEAEWENTPQGASKAHQLLSGIAAAIGHRAFLHESTFGAPQSHGGIPHDALLAHCQSLMPQIYRVPNSQGTLGDITTIVNRALAQNPPLAKNSLGGLLIATVNRPSMLKAISAHTDVFDGANVWLWDGDTSAPSHGVKEDPGVKGIESEWTEAIAAWRTAMTPPVVAPSDATPPVVIAVDSERRVKTDGLNLRREPRVPTSGADNILTSLPVGNRVDVLEPGADWTKVKTVRDGQQFEGYVATRFLRPPASASVERLMEQAILEYYRFGKGQRKETESPFDKRIGEYWQAIGLNLTGQDTDTPWSAAFISWIVRRASYPTNSFKFGAAHSIYIRDSYKRRVSGDATAAFWAYKLDEHHPKLGDLVCKTRQGALNLTNLPADFISHCDVIVEVLDGKVRTIGGNVSNSVSMTEYPLDGNGFVKAGAKAFAILGNRL